MKPSIVVVGSINLDLVVMAHSIPQPGETVSGSAVAEFEGGKGANQAVGVARLGAPCKMIGCVGQDHYGARLRSALAAAGVQVEDVATVSGPSGLALITHAEHGENSIVVVPGANSAVTPELLQALRTHWMNASMVLAQLEIPLPTLEALAKILATQDVPLMLDPAPAAPLSKELLRAVTWITPNETEACTLLQLQPEGAPPEHVAARLLQMGPRNVVLKLGARGVYLAGQDVAATFVPGYAVHAVDTTAAGDTFNAAFATRLTLGDAPVEAARYANAAAALSVQRMGAQPSMPTAAEVDAFLAARTSSNHVAPATTQA